MTSRRSFLKDISTCGTLALLPFAARQVLAPDGDISNDGSDERISLNGEWSFRFDEKNSGINEKWYDGISDENWNTVSVPHTWQIDPEYAEYFGVAWYKKSFTAPTAWKGKTIRIEFEAVYHSATVWINGQKAGGHLRKGYTAFFIDISDKIYFNEINTIAVMADNHFDDDMLPRNHSYDWAADGGITRPVTLHITSPAFIERIMINAMPDIAKNNAEIKITAVVKNNSNKSMQLQTGYLIAEESSGNIIFNQQKINISLKAKEAKEITFVGLQIVNPKLWHFDHPHLYIGKVFLYHNDEPVHSYKANFGIKKIEIKNAGFYLNGERVRLMGVERMAGSNPAYGMAEPAHWIEHDHRDLKELNCVFTRVHWQQDKRVLDYCDRHGILIQLEVPSWGGATFSGMKEQPSEIIMQNGLEQLTEQIFREYNHPCIFSWGLCNEIYGQNLPAYHFAENMLNAAKKLDPHRLCSYASNSLQETQSRDVTRLMDFIEWNEYYESWYSGTTGDMEKNLEQIHRVFPDKPIVISEYGWCRCSPDRKEGDVKLVNILQNHDAVFRKHDYMAGLIFFCYNDYRTHIGDKGVGPLKQRIHGVVDLFGKKKGSYNVLQKESSPVEEFKIEKNGPGYMVSLVSRNSIPSYTLTGYRIRVIAYGEQDIPLEEILLPLSDVLPGSNYTKNITFQLKGIEKIEADLLRPTDFSVDTTILVLNS